MASSAAFEAASVDTIVVTAAGRDTLVKNYGHLPRDDAAWAAGAAAFARKVADVTEVLARRALAGRRGPRRMRVMHHDPCRLSQIAAGPRQRGLRMRVRPIVKLLDRAHAAVEDGSNR